MTKSCGSRPRARIGTRADPVCPQLLAAPTFCIPPPPITSAPSDVPDELDLREETNHQLRVRAALVRMKAARKAPATFAEYAELMWLLSTQAIV